MRGGVRPLTLQAECGFHAYGELRLGARELEEPAPGIDRRTRGQLLHKAPDGQLFDSLAVDREGWVNVATIVNGGITSVSPDGSEVIHTPVPDPIVTNICFGGDGLGTAFITASASGTLYSTPWPRAGLDLAY